GRPLCPRTRAEEGCAGLIEDMHPNLIRNTAEAQDRIAAPVAARDPPQPDRADRPQEQAAGPAGGMLVASAAQGVHSRRDCGKIAFEIPILYRFTGRCTCTSPQRAL